MKTMNRQRLCSAFLASILWLTTPADAADTVPGLPAYGPDKPLPLPEVSRERLPNGLELWLIRRAGLPLLSVRLAIRGGTAADDPGRQGISELLADTLASGTERHDARQIAEILQAAGAELAASAGDDGITLAVTGLTEGAREMLATLAEVALTPTFPEPEVKLAVTNKLQELLAEENDPDFMTSRVFYRTLFGDHPYHYSHPDKAAVAAVDAESLRRLHRQRFHPERALLVMVGDLPEQQMRKLASAYFGSWRSGKTTLSEIPDAPLQPASHRLQLVARKGSVQSTIRAGRPLPPADHPDYPALTVANTIFGGSFGSRLTRNIREEKGYTYSPRSSISRLAHGGLFSVQASVRNEVTAAALVEIFYELDRLATTLPTSEELQRAQRYRKGIFLLRNETAASLAGTLSAYWLKGLDIEDLRQQVSRIEAVTAEQVRQVAARYLTSRQQAVVVTGDAEAVRPQLEPLLPVEEARP